MSPQGGHSPASWVTWWRVAAMIEWLLGELGLILALEYLAGIFTILISKNSKEI